MDSKVKPVEIFESSYNIYLFGEINENVAESICSQLITCYIADPTRSIKIVIDSIGGTMSSAIAIVSVMSSISNPIEGIVSGNCMSAATLIFLSCDRRACFENSLFMTHQFQAGTFGTYSKLASTNEFYLKVHEILISIYMRVLGFSREDVISKILPDGKDIYLSDKEAYELGIVKEILKYKPAKNSDLFYPVEKKKVKGK